ncbi:MAG: UvrD-helicase domain-containing protein [Endomicrobia bacterium]|nr:UvrD-helicase domain-containing protein [Endomicrobiia bacterium]
MKDLFKELNEQQKKAVEYIDGPMVVFAGAGSGKTRVITYRIAYLLSIGVNPYNILAVTFTNKAAEEMKQRVTSLVPEKGKYVWISTFHSLCANILYAEAENFGLDRNFVIYDETDSIKVIKECLKEMSFDTKKISLYDIYDSICRAKDNLVDVKSYGINTELMNNPVREIISEVYLRYQKKLENNRVFDFGDLIMKLVEFFRDPKYENITNKYIDRFKYIHVDEYQDVNHAQVTLLKILSSKHKNICVVGDDDQAIYSWRGSDVKYLLNFPKEFSKKDLPVKEFVLEKNYRSKQSILDIGNVLISNNKYRHPKNLFSDKVGDINQDIKINYFKNEYEEAKFVAKEIMNLMNKVDSIAVLYRTNAQSRIFEEVFMQYNIPYKIYGAVKFYSRQEIKDVIAYLKILINPYDETSLKRIINVPPRNIGETTILYLSTLAKERQTSLWEQLVRIDETELSLRTKNSVWKFLTLYNVLRKDKECMYPAEFISSLIEKVGYLEYIQNNFKSDEKVKNIQELISLAKDFENKYETPSIEEFIKLISLFTNNDDMTSYSGSNSVFLMTLHMAKGLEFDVVFLVGLEEGTLPIYCVTNKEFSVFKYINCSGNLNEEYEFGGVSIEEERRLCYVGITRAKSKLYLTYSLSKRVLGVEKDYYPSRFIDEIISLYVNSKIQQCEREDIKENLSSELKNTDDHDVLRVGEYVIHDKFGVGKIIDILREPLSEKVVVKFQDGKERKLSLSFAKLRKM